MKKKLTLALIFGGRSAEHEVSIQSGKSVLAAIDRKKYRLIFIGIARDGRWFLLPEKTATGFFRSAVPGTQLTDCQDLPKRPMVVDVMNLKKSLGIDVAFPILHGPFGEDGSIQSLLKIADIPFVGSDVAASAICMDKDLSKRFLNDAGVPTARALTYQNHQLTKISFAKARRALGLPLFVKPANMGSSVGVAKVSRQAEFMPAIKNAFKYDQRILIEEAISAREIECGILGNENPEASLPGEVIAQKDFYSYDAKYVLSDGAALKIPADLPKAMVDKIQKLALKVYKVLGCEGLARVDFFLKKNGGLVVNEINTIPGFVRGVSMYPVLWEASGIPYARLLDMLIDLALKRTKKE